MEPYRLVLADDHTLFRQGLKRILSDMADLEIIGEAGDSLELLDLLRRVNPHMIILDIRMPNLRGIEAIPEIRKIHPDVKVLMLSMYSDIEFLHQAFSAGANGYLVKGDAETQVFLAIEAIRRGEIFITPSLSADLVADWAQKNRSQRGLSSIDPLTPREKEILKWIAEGKSYKEIAGLLSISPYTVLRHRANIMDKLNLRKSSDLIKYALQKSYL
jgi:two-component system, NarL family, response regulator NreC